MSKPSILVLASTFYPKINGTTLAISDHIDNLVQNGHKVFLITKQLEGTKKTEEWHGTTVIRIGPRRGSVLAWSLFMLNQTIISLLLIRRFKIQIIHANGLLPLWAGILAGKMMRVPVVVTIHGLQRTWLPEARWRTNSNLALTFPAEKFAMKLSDAIIAQSEEFREVLAHDYDLDARKIAVIPHPIDIALFSPEIMKPNQTKPIILFVGTLGRIHGPDILVESAPLILKNMPAALIQIVGRGPMKAKLENRIRELKIESSVTLTGPINDRNKIARMYRDSSVVIIPVRYPGYFLTKVAVEAMSCGKPVVTTLKLNPDLENKGVFLTGSSPPQIANEILSILQMSESSYSRISTAAREYVLQNCSIARVTSATEQVYERLLDTDLAVKATSKTGRQ